LIYESLRDQFEEEGVVPYELNYEQAVKICKNTKGIGNGCMTTIALIYGSPEDITPDYTDRGFVDGFKKFYELDRKPTKKEMLAKTKNWSDVEVGNMLIRQCFYYLK